MNRGPAMLVAWMAIYAMMISASPALGQLADVTVRVDGLSCPFCAYNLEKQLKQVPGAGELVIDVADGIATITPDGDTPVDFAKLPRAVLDAGFTPREIRVRGTGMIRREADRLTLVDAAGNAVFILMPGGVLDQLQVDDEITVEFEGLVSIPEDGDAKSPLPELELTTASPRSGD